jgi:hypothetical protein
MHLETLNPALAAFGLVLAMAGSALAADTALGATLATEAPRSIALLRELWKSLP